MLKTWNSWRRKWQLTQVFLPRKFLGQRSLAGYSSWDQKETDTTSYTYYLNFKEDTYLSVLQLCIDLVAL